MTTLTSHPVSALLERLFAEADNATAPALAAFAGMPQQERARLLRSKEDYRALYAQLKDVALPVSPETGALLYMLARGSRAKLIVEFGTSFGLSTLHLAAALRDNGGGHLISTEFEPSKVQRARDNLAAGGLLDLVEIREGDALQTLRQDIPGPIDLLLLDGAKALYADILHLLAPHLRPGALILADNADYCPDYLALVRAPGSGYLSLPFGADVELSMKC
jgi:predicted O-methyltransferase YrrM